MGSNLLLDQVTSLSVYGIYSLNPLFTLSKVIKAGSNAFDSALIANDLLQVVWTRISKFGILKQVN